MKHETLDFYLKMELDMFESSELVYSTVIDDTKTAIIHYDSGDTWLYQSSTNIDGFETGVDMIRLTSDMVEVIKNKC